jgi:hypothetical protein
MNRFFSRTNPALLDIAGGLPVGALVFARNAVAGDLWSAGGRRVVLDEAVVGGGLPARRLRPA